ncbi:SurA N-terminal domain-containing protein [Rodentibacter caecimuris]|uniref:Periplasmic chaperone PpiD n=1 Tax=Rodentibacter caecimuris TaxID=1796644 RepID=A0ABX3L162_9PAST|nr:peptidylprolyl isomerase [Rodentibacter heylii]
MLIEKLHGAANSTFAKAILGLITLSFLIGGMSGYLFSSTDVSAAKVNGESISQQSFLNEYNQVFEQRAQQEGLEFLSKTDSPDFVNALRQSVINQMINQELLRQYVEELKLNVSDDMVKRAIVADPTFQTEGKFNNSVYLERLRQSNLNPNLYAEILRRGLTFQQLQNGLSQSEFVVTAQADEMEKLLFQKRFVRLARFNFVEESAKQNVTQEEIKNYYENNRTSLIQPEQAKVQYISFSRADVEKEIQVSDVEIAQYYQDNKTQFMAQNLAHIQLENEQTAQDVYQQLKQGANFSELAKKLSVDTLSAQNGGDLGWISANELPKAFEEHAATLNVGEFSSPINVDGKYHIILVKERKTQDLAQVKNYIADLVRKNLAENRFFTIEKQMAEKAFEDSNSLESAAKAANVKLQETDYFSRQNIPTELNFPNVISTIFGSDISNGGINSDALNVGDQHIIFVRILDHKAEGILSLNEATPQIEQLLKHQKAEQVLSAQAEQYIEKLKENPNAKIGNITLSQSQAFRLNENQDPILTSGIFAIEKPEESKPTYQIVRSSNGDVVVAALDKVEDGNLPETDKQQFQQQLLQSHRLEFSSLLLQALREKAQIEINQAFINQETNN